MSINIHEAKTHLSRLIERVAAGETVVIARAGQPVAQLTPVGAPAAPQPLGFLAGQASIPDDFDDLGAESIAEIFGGAG